MPTYKHRQFGTIIVIGLGSGIIMALLILLHSETEPAKTISTLVFAILVICLLFFWSLTVEVKSDHILVYFGFGFIHRKISFAEIQQVNVVRTFWYYGWGIRPAPHGWMFNVSGFGGVELIFPKNERFRIGSDQPGRLAEAIQTQMQKLKDQ